MLRLGDSTMKLGELALVGTFKLPVPPRSADGTREQGGIMGGMLPGREVRATWPREMGRGGMAFEFVRCPDHAPHALMRRVELPLDMAQLLGVHTPEKVSEGRSRREMWGDLRTCSRRRRAAAPRGRALTARV